MDGAERRSTLDTTVFKVLEAMPPVRKETIDRVVRGEHALIRLRNGASEESAWVRLTGYDPMRNNFVGYLANDSVRLGFKHGQRVEFQRQHINRVLLKHKE